MKLSEILKCIKDDRFVCICDEPGSCFAGLAGEYKDDECLGACRVQEVRPSLYAVGDGLDIVLEYPYET